MDNQDPLDQQVVQEIEEKEEPPEHRALLEAEGNQDFLDPPVQPDRLVQLEHQVIEEKMELLELKDQEERLGLLELQANLVRLAPRDHGES